MAITVRMPEVLANVTEAAVQKWLVAPGDEVSVGQPFAEIETEKAVVEFAAETAGTVLQLLVPEGDTVDVGSPIAVVGAPGDAVTVEEAAPAAPAATQQAATRAAGAEPVPSPAASPTASPAPAPAAQQEPVNSGASASGGAGHGGRQFVSPLVRRLAKERGLSLAGVVGSGPEGRIVRKDLDGLAAGVISAAPAPAAVAPTHGAEPVLVPHSKMRKTIARRLTESKNQVPHFYLTADCRVDRLLALRKEINEAGGVKISVNDLVVKAVAKAFVDVPRANRTWSDEGMVHYSQVDIAFAVSLEDGLVVPVVRGVDQMTVSALSLSIQDLAERARSGGLKQHEIEGGSFAVSNLGMFGTKEFSAIINPPQAGILAVGAARQSPVVVDGVLEVGSVMTVTLSADHRAWDGALAAEWLAAFQKGIENPAAILA